MNAGVTGCPVALLDSSCLAYLNPTRVAWTDSKVFHFLDVMPWLCLLEPGWLTTQNVVLVLILMAAAVSFQAYALT